MDSKFNLQSLDIFEKESLIKAAGFSLFSLTPTVPLAHWCVLFPGHSQPSLMTPQQNYNGWHKGADEALNDAITNVIIPFASDFFNMEESEFEKVELTQVLIIMRAAYDKGAFEKCGCTALLH